jgi:hypothetical protein
MSRRHRLFCYTLESRLQSGNIIWKGCGCTICMSKLQIHTSNLYSPPGFYKAQNLDGRPKDVLRLGSLASGPNNLVPEH